MQCSDIFFIFVNANGSLKFLPAEKLNFPLGRLLPGCETMI